MFNESRAAIAASPEGELQQSSSDLANDREVQSIDRPKREHKLPKRYRVDQVRAEEQQWDDISVSDSDINTFTGLSPFGTLTCMHCGSEFGRDRGLQRHLLSVHHVHRTFAGERVLDDAEWTERMAALRRAQMNARSRRRAKAANCAMGASTGGTGGGQDLRCAQLGVGMAGSEGEQRKGAGLAAARRSQQQTRPRRQQTEIEQQVLDAQGLQQEIALAAARNRLGASRRHLVELEEGHQAALAAADQLDRLAGPRGGGIPGGVVPVEGVVAPSQITQPVQASCMSATGRIRGGEGMRGTWRILIRDRVRDLAPSRDADLQGR